MNEEMNYSDQEANVFPLRFQMCLWIKPTPTNALPEMNTEKQLWLQPSMLLKVS